MKKRSKGILYKTTIIPSLMFVVISLAIPLLGYIFYKQTYSLSLHEKNISDSISAKQHQIQIWLVSSKKEVENIASTNTIKSSLISHTPKMHENKTIKPKTKDVGSDDTKTKVNIFLEARLTDPRFSLISVISKEGKIVFSTSQDLVNHSIAETDIYKTLISKGDKTLVLGMWANHDNQYVIDIITPIKDSNLEIKGYLHCALNTNEIKSILADKPKHVSSFELVDRQGNILMSSETNIKDKKRYNPQLFEGEKTQYHLDTIISVKNIKDMDLLIIQKSKTLEVFYPLVEIATVYTFIVFFVIIIFIKQSIFLKKKVVRPLSLLISTLRSASAGIQTASIKGKYPYEIDMLLQEINMFLDGIAKSKTSVDIVQKTTETDVSNKTSHHEPSTKNQKLTFLHEITSIDKDYLYETIKSILEDCDGLKTFSEIREAMLLLGCIVQNYNLLSEIKKDDSPQRFSLQGLLTDIKDEVARLMSVTNTEAIFEHDEIYQDIQIEARKDVLLLVVSLILHHSFINTLERSITVFCNIYDEPTKHLLILISDNTVRDKGNILIRIAKKISDDIGFDLSTETIQGKGTTYYLKIQL
ncbi:MAG: cache domain-containing protein [Thermodesulfovibrionales bacterium]|nr:cache domain-containing protein [Thermodesulfovibrionales bacterium]